MPRGGYGNLIALPLQKKAREKFNSIFVDKNYEAYPDQWEYHINSVYNKDNYFDII